MQPKDEDEFADMLWTMANHHDGPIAIRYPRGAGTGAKPKAQPKILEIGKSEVLRHGSRACIFALGNMVELALQAADALEKQGVSTAVVNARWIKPLDTVTLEFFARGCEVVCTMEDHVLPNGFGCSVMEHLSEQHITTPVVRVGWPDQFVEHGTLPILRQKHGLTAEAATAKILAALPAKVSSSSSKTAA
jgi:1-deoxy-D-xylulose-5-phosphate synthase